MLKITTNKTRIKIDYGNGAEKTDTLHNIIQALNVMSENGWELIQCYPITTQTSMGAGAEVHYILRRKILNKQH